MAYRDERLLATARGGGGEFSFVQLLATMFSVGLYPIDVVAALYDA